MATKFQGEDALTYCQDETPTSGQCKTCKPFICALMVRLLYKYNRVRQYLRNYNANYREIETGIYQLYYDCKKCQYRVKDKTKIAWDGKSLELKPHLGEGEVDIGRNSTTYKLRIHSRKCGSKPLHYSGPSGTGESEPSTSAGTVRGDESGIPRTMEWTVLTRPVSCTINHRESREVVTSTGGIISEMVPNCENNSVATSPDEYLLSEINPSDWCWDTDCEIFLAGLTD